MKTVKAYKLFTQRNGKLYPLFIGKTKETTIGNWVEAEFIPTQGYATRPGWHAGVLPIAPHLRTRENRIRKNRVWAEVELPAMVDYQPIADSSPTKDIRGTVPVQGFYRFKTSKMQGDAWLIGGALKVNKVLTDAEVLETLVSAGIEAQEAIRETH